MLAGREHIGVMGARRADPAPCAHARPLGAAAGAAVAAASGLRLTGVTHAFARHRVICDASLSIARGEIACLLGPSGCGKTTLLRLAAGLEPLQQGRIEIGGRVVADTSLGLHLAPEARRVGLMFQDFALFPHLTVAENVRFGITRSAGNDEWTRAALARTGLTAWADAYPHTLSGGQQQRCALLRALAPHPDLLLLDEPFSGLDATLRAQVRDETAAFLREAGTPTLIVTHDPEEAMCVADRLLVMRDGRILQDGSPEEVYLAPVDPFVASFFGPPNEWMGPVRGGVVDTPAGAVGCPKLADGTMALVLIRPEGVVLDPAGSGAFVVESRLVGCLSAITIETTAPPWRLRVLVSRLCLPAPGTPFGVRFDAARTFVFPLPSPGVTPLPEQT